MTVRDVAGGSSGGGDGNEDDGNSGDDKNIEMMTRVGTGAGEGGLWPPPCF